MGSRDDVVGAAEDVVEDATEDESSASSTGASCGLVAVGLLPDVVGGAVRALRREARQAPPSDVPPSLFNVTITRDRVFAARPFEVERLAAVASKAPGASIDDVVLAMCSGAIRRYLVEQQALPDSSLVAMVPVGLKANQSGSASADSLIILA